MQDLILEICQLLKNKQIRDNNALKNVSDFIVKDNGDCRLNAVNQSRQ